MNHQTRDITGNLLYSPAVNTAKNGNKYATCIVGVAMRVIKVDGTIEQRSEYYLFNVWGESQVEALSRGQAGDDFRVAGTPQIREKLLEDGRIQENLELTNIHVWMSHGIANRKIEVSGGSATATQLPGSVAPPDPNATSGTSIADTPF